MTFLGFIVTLLLALGVFLLPRRAAALALVAAVCYVTQGQVVELAGFHFTTIRVVLLAGLLRGIAQGELSRFRVTGIDKMFFLYLTVSALLFVVRNASVQAAISETGIAYNLLFAYLSFRWLLGSYEEVEDFVAGLAYLIVPMAVLMVYEANSGNDVFSIFGGLDQEMFRDGHFRCSGAFRSPITAGTLGATLLPLFVGLYWTTPRRMAAVIGIMAATTITLTSRSSGPAIEYLCALGALALWRWRHHTQLMRRGLVVTLIALQLVMKAHVWFLIARLSDLIGGGGWHRAEIIEQAVLHFGSWWIWGTGQTGDWMATQVQDGSSDLTNQFVAEGVTAGLGAMLLFIWIIVRSFRNLGAAMRKVAENSPELEKFLWALGAALFATVVNFFSVSYFDQINVIWWMLTAMIAAASTDLLERSEEFQADEVTVEVLDERASPTPMSGQMPRGTSPG